MFGGLFLGEPALGQSRFVGATRQRTASDLPHHPLVDKHPFAYVGSEGPIEFNSTDLAAWQALGQALTKATHLRGLFGVDAIKHATRGWVLLELNPRWTAAVELLERAYSFNAFGCHVETCHGESIAPPWSRFRSGKFIVKRIVYAVDRLEVERSLRHKIDQLPNTPTEISAHDVPRVGTTIEALHPLMTLIATGTNLGTARERLDAAAEWVLAAPRRTSL